MEGKKSVTEGVEGMDTDRKAEELLDRRPEEGIKVDGLLWTRNDTNAEDVLEVGADVWAEVVIEKDEGPGGLGTPFERSKPVRRQAECYIAWVLEELVGQLLAVDRDVLVEEIAVVLGVHDIADDIGGVLLLFLVAVLHLLSHWFAGEEGFQARDDGQVHENLARLAGGVVAWFGAVRTGGIRRVGPRESTARVDAAIIECRLKAGQTSNTGLDVLPSGYIAVGESEGKLCKSLPWHVRIDLECERP